MTTQEEFFGMIHAITEHSGESGQNQHLLLSVALLGGTGTYKELRKFGIPKRSAARTVARLVERGAVDVDNPGAPFPNKVTLNVSCPPSCTWVSRGAWDIS